MTNEIGPGTRVCYYQPGIDEILGSWAKKPIRVVGDVGDLRVATVTKVSRDDERAYYDTEEGVLLTDSDIREVLA